MKKEWKKPVIKVIPCEIEKFTANKNYILREIAGESVLVSVGEEIADFCGIVNLNASARVLWETLQDVVTKKELVQAFTEKFDVTVEKALADVENVLNMLLERGLVKHV